MLLPSKAKLFDFEKVLNYDFFNFLDVVYQFNSKNTSFKTTDASRQLFYGRCRVVTICMVISEEA